ncbi:hypothetical protein G4V62_12920 [Bacillaceae bacterium SIJ1]|nr:hypothetical protein [Litoribacterium kuwaitense]
MLVFIALWYVNYGEVRFYLLLALLLGVSIYQALLKKAYLSVLNGLISCIITLSRIVKKTLTILIWSPLAWMVHFVIFCIRAMATFLWKCFYWIFRTFIGVPVKWFAALCWRMLPKSVRRFFQHWEGKAVAFKNTCIKWIKRLKR